MKKLIIAIALVCVGFGAQAQVKSRVKIDKNVVVVPQKEVAVIPVTSKKGKMTSLISPNGKFRLFAVNPTTLALIQIVR